MWGFIIVTAEKNPHIKRTRLCLCLVTYQWHNIKAVRNRETKKYKKVDLPK